jgi:hypothetical protein
VSTTDNRTVCERLDHLDRLLVCLADALRQGTEYRENDATQPTLCTGTRGTEPGQSGRNQEGEKASHDTDR